MKYLFALITLLFITVSFSQHSINGTFKPTENYTHVFLYKATPTGAHYVTQSKITQDGTFSIFLDSTVTKGIYKLVYAIPPEENNFDIFYNAQEDIELHFEEGKDVAYAKSNENILWEAYLKNIDVINGKIQSFYAENNSDINTYKELFKNLKNSQETFEKSSTEMMIHPFIVANRAYIPESYEGIETYFSGLNSNYLKHIDFNNTLIQSSDFLSEKVLAFVFDMISNPNDAFFKSQVEMLANSIQDNDEIKTALLELVWQEFIRLENDAMAIYITDTYLQELAKKTNNNNLLKLVNGHKKTAIGAQASNFTIKNSQTLHDLNTSEKYLVIFWSSSCGHCLDELPLVQEYLSSIPKEKLSIIAFGLENTDTLWKETITQFPNFTHVIGLQKWDNPVANDYNVNATPMYFLLDENKNITAKPYDFEALKKVITIN